MGAKQPVAGPSKPRASVNAPVNTPPPPSALSAFSPSGSLFALAHPALGSADKLTVWDVDEDRVVVEWEIEGASKASSICWVSTSSGAHGKKRRKKDAGEVEDVVVVTTTKGQLFSFSPSRGVQRRLDLPSPATACASSEAGMFLVSTTALHLISPDLSTLSASIPLPPNAATPTAIAILDSTTAESAHVVIASTTALVLHIDLSTHKITESSAALPVSTSPVSSLTALPTTPQGTSFLVISDDDRTVSQYTIPSGTKARLSYRYASPTLSPAHSASIHPSYLSVLHKSGEISVFPFPAQLALPNAKTDSKPSFVRLLEGKTERQARICRAGFSTADDKTFLVCGRMMGAGRIVWVHTPIESTEGTLLPEVRIRADGQDLVGKSDKSAGSLQRFSAPAGTTDLPPADASAPQTLPTDVDMADLSLGERLLAIPNSNGDVPNGAEAKAKDAAPALDGPVNAQSLTRLLVQALHTSDPALLSLCLSHRDPVLIRNTIRKMPVQLALPLLKACVERLGQGKGANKKGGGRGAGQNEQQGRGTVEWVKGVLVERGAILMTMPSLPAQLSSLSRLLDTRLQLYQPLLSLSGRLDLALAQISMRRIALEQANAASQKREEQGTHYIEGESDDEDVEVEMGDGGGEVEDVDMRLNGADSDEESEEESSDDEENSEDDEDEEDDEDDEDPLESDDGEGLLELEAEESDDESAASSEED